MPKLSTKNVAEAIHATVRDKKGADLDSAIKMSVDFLAKKNLLSKAPEILKTLENILDNEQGILKVKVYSIKPLNKKQADEVETILKKRSPSSKVVIEWKEDKSLLSGMRMETKDEVIDLSLKNKINQLQNYLLTN